MIEIFGFFIMGVMGLIASFMLIGVLGAKFKEFRHKEKYTEDGDLSGAIIGFVIVVVPLIMFFIILS